MVHACTYKSSPSCVDACTYISPPSCMDHHQGQKVCNFVVGVGRFLQNCHLHSVSEGTGAITAQRRQSPSEDTGFTFLGCKVTGVKTALLGRPWGPYSRVVFAFSYMSGDILPEGWDDWGDSSKQRFILYIHNYTYICTTIWFVLFNLIN